MVDGNGKGQSSWTCTLVWIHGTMVLACLKVFNEAKNKGWEWRYNNYNFHFQPAFWFTNVNKLTWCRMANPNGWCLLWHHMKPLRHSFGIWLMLPRRSIKAAVVGLFGYLRQHFWREAKVIESPRVCSWEFFTVGNWDRRTARQSVWRARCYVVLWLCHGQLAWIAFVLGK